MLTKPAETQRTAPVSLPRIKAVVDQIARAASPAKIVLFGSHARGNATRDSDVDLLVVTRRAPDPNMSLAIRRQINYDFPLDLVVIGTKRLVQRIEQGDNFLCDVLSSGKVLYESPHR